MNTELSQNQFANNNSQRFALVGAGAAAIGVACLISSGCTVTTICGVAFGALSLVALAYCTLHASRKLREWRHHKVQTLISNENPIDRLPDDARIEIFWYSENTALGDVCSKFRRSENLLIETHKGRLSRFIQPYNLDEKKEGETTRGYMRRSIAIVFNKQERILKREGSLKGFSTLAALRHIEEREEIVENKVLDQFCQKVPNLTPPSFETPLAEKADQWKSELESGGSSITDLHLTGLIRLPSAIGCLTSLTSLLLMDNHIESLPQSIGALTSLTVLDLSKNQLQRLPESFCDLRNMNVLKLTNNQLESLPESINNLKNLSRLELDDNQLVLSQFNSDK